MPLYQLQCKIRTVQCRLLVLLVWLAHQWVKVVSRNNAGTILAHNNNELINWTNSSNPVIFSMKRMIDMTAGAWAALETMFHVEKSALTRTSAKAISPNRRKLQTLNSQTAPAQRQSLKKQLDHRIRWRLCRTCAALLWGLWLVALGPAAWLTRCIWNWAPEKEVMHHQFNQAVLTIRRARLRSLKFSKMGVPENTLMTWRFT